VSTTSEPDTAWVLVVEDHPVVAEGLVALLEAHPQLEVLAAAHSVAEADGLARRHHVDVAIVDFRLPDGTGADAAVRIREHRPEAAVVFLSADDSDQAMLAAIEAGASGYLVKSAAGPEIVETVRRAADGEMLIAAPKLAALLARRREVAGQDDDRTRRLEELTPRQHEILQLMTQGMDNREIADRLNIAYPTVRSHVRKVLEKLGARSRLEAVVKAALDREPQDEGH
jgi:two-component system, NarL family, nitrate/nitrite response regulator NarL